jgi:hypothetical protein
MSEEKNGLPGKTAQPTGSGADVTFALARPSRLPRDPKRQARAQLAGPAAVDRLPPHSIEAEQGVLGCALLSPHDCIGECIEKFAGGPEVFYDLRHRALYEVLVEMHQRGAIDTITVHQVLKDRKQLDAVGGLAYLASLPDAVPSAANLAYYIEIVREKFVLRRVISTCSDVVARAYDHEGEATLLLENVGRDVAGLLQDLPDSRPEARSIGALARPSVDDGTELIQSRYLCRGGGLLLVGQSGQGKSSLALQMSILWSLGRSCFGLRPTQPLRVLVIQSENDDGDSWEMFHGIASGLALTESEIEKSGANILLWNEDTRSGQDFFRGVVEPLVKKHRPDLIVIDPAFAYIDDDSKDAEAVGRFLRRGLNPLLHRYGCAALVIHHTTKAKSDGPQSTHDFLYAGAGSIEWSNWSRAVLVLETKGKGCFALHAPKRGSRIGWRNAAGDPCFAKFIRHTRTPDQICWHEVDEMEIESVARSGKSRSDLLAQVPLEGAIPQTVLFAKAQASGIGQKKARAFLDELLEEGTVHLWLVARKGTNHEKRIGRQPQGDPELIHE